MSKHLYSSNGGNEVSINMREDGSFFLSDQISEKTVEFDLKYIDRLGENLGEAVRLASLSFTPGDAA